MRISLQLLTTGLLTVVSLFFANRSLAEGSSVIAVPPPPPAKIASVPRTPIPDVPTPSSGAAVEVERPTNQVGVDGKLEFMPQFSIFNASTLQVQTTNYGIDYGSVLEGVPIVHAAMALPLANWRAFQFLVNAHLGFGTVRDVFPVSWKVAPSGAKPQDRVRLNLIPISLSSEVRYAVPGIPFFQPSLAFGAGGHLLLQRNGGALPSENYWLPHLFFRPAITFFDAATTSHWFGGFLFGVSWYRSVGDGNLLRGTSFDLSLKILL